MRTYASSRVKRKSFYKKSELQMFLLISGSQNGAPIWRLCTKLYKSEWMFRQITQKLWDTKTWELDKLFLLVFYNISLCWLLPLDSFQFSFLLCDSENNLLLKTESLDNAILELWLA